jgi:hypothetical protein
MVACVALIGRYQYFQLVEITKKNGKGADLCIKKTI